MSKVTTVYETLIEKIAELFPDKTRIPNAYLLTANNDNLMKNGWGLRVDPADYEEHEFCSFMVNRTFTIIFTREMFRLNSSVEEYDSIVPEMLEDVYNIQEMCFNYNELGIDAAIAKVDIGSCSGIESFINDKQNYYKIECSFSFSIKESFKGV